MKFKSQTFDYFRKFKETIESKIRNKIRILYIDRGGEYSSNDFRAYYKNNGIRRELTQALKPQQNGVLEHRNRTIIERACSLVHEASLPAYLWPEVVETTNHLVNLNPTRANLGITPNQRYSGKIPIVEHLQVFGCVAYMHIPKKNRKKLYNKTQKCMFLGYDTESKVYRLYNHHRKKIFLSKLVTFDESKVGFQYLTQNLPELEVTFSFSLGRSTDPLAKASTHQTELEFQEIAEQYDNEHVESICLSPIGASTKIESSTIPVLLVTRSSSQRPTPAIQCAGPLA
jgi:hypothetical protein